MDSLQRAYHQELSSLSAERAAFAASLDAARRSTEAHPMDADRAKVGSRLCCHAGVVCGLDCCLPFEASDMLPASLGLGMMLIGHDIGSVQHTRCSPAGPGGICWSFMDLIHQACRMADCRLYGRWRACSGGLTRRSTMGWTPCLVQRTRCILCLCACWPGQAFFWLAQLQLASCNLVLLLLGAISS